MGRRCLTCAGPEMSSCACGAPLRGWRNRRATAHHPRVVPLRRWRARGPGRRFRSGCARPARGGERLRTEAAHERQRAAEVDRGVLGNRDAVEGHEALVCAVARISSHSSSSGRLQERDILVHLVPQGQRSRVLSACSTMTSRFESLSTSERRIDALGVQPMRRGQDERRVTLGEGDVAAGVGENQGVADLHVAVQGGGDLAVGIQLVVKTRVVAVPADSEYWRTCGCRRASRP